MNNSNIYKREGVGYQMDLKDSYAVCLSPELAAVAARELNETPAARRQALVDFRRLLREEGSLSPGTEERDEVLLRFLRCKKFDVQRSLSVYKGYKSYREDNPNLFKDLEISNVSHVWESGIIGALPTRDLKGRAVMVSFPGRWEPETHSLEDVLRAMVLQLEHLIQSNETQIHGIVLIADFKDFSLYQARCIRPWYFQMLSALVQNAFPARFKGVYIINQPWYISLIMAIVSRLLSEKMNSRIHMLGNDLQELGNHFNIETLPAEFGGSCPPYQGSDWIKIMEEGKTNARTTTPTIDPPINDTPILTPHVSSVQTEV